ncbi:MAG TPA: thermonuclease family protein [Ohtaekwangia sp.]|uniref:thermonuclease family protein n=1 Tax=Ohtaekwangia sp. TaxID=2066019 RepID=UPI002F944808
MKTIKITLLLLFVSLASTMAYDTVTGKVTAVIDGNTLEVTADNNEIHKVMLAGIDCPEITQEFGEQARQYLEKLTLNKKVTVNFTGKDRWGNYLGIVLIKGSVDPRVDLLKEGLAWTAERNPDPEFEAHRARAQEKGKGLWKDSNPTPPWTYRREQSMMEAKSS